MKSKKIKADYSRLKIKIFFQMLGMILGAIIIIIIMYNLIWAGRGANWVVSVFQNIFGIEYEAALALYENLFRSNADFVMYGVIVIVFIVILWFFLTWFTRYFNEINRGIDMLLKDDLNEIILSPDLLAIEKKLNTVRQNLKTRALEVQLAEQRKNDLVMYLAHDIKTPLTSVIGYLSLLDEAPDMPMEQKAKYVHITLHKAYRLEQLIDEFFEITRYNLQTISLSKKTIDLYYMLIQMTDEFYPHLAANGKQVVVHAPEELTVYGDPDKLARVFNNILKNAIAYSADNSVIDITAYSSGDMLSIVFKNPGSISKDKLASVFEKFYRLDDARSTDKGGAGLGLAIAREIIVLHGGQIHAESNDEYTAFTVELPIMHSSIDIDDEIPKK